jgi:hypothetical protein
MLPALPSSVPTADPAAMPHIALERSARVPEWLKWAVLFLLATAAGAAAFFLMPWLYSLRLFW